MTPTRKKRDPLIALRIPPALDKRLRAEADSTGSSISEVVRDAIENRLAPNGTPEPATTTNAGRAKIRAAGVAKSGMCEHRIRTGAYCRHCERIIA